MDDIDPELIEKAAEALHDLRSIRSRARHEVGQPLGDTVYDNERRADARVALSAVIDDIRAEAWDEGRKATDDEWKCLIDGHPGTDEGEMCERCIDLGTNPYRKESK